MKSFHCRECGEQVEEFCAAHPQAIVDTIISRSGPTLSEQRRRELGNVRLQLRVPEETVARLDTLCERGGVSRSEMVATLVGAAPVVLHKLPRGANGGNR